MKSICIFCGARPGNKDSYSQAARELSTFLVSRNIRIVCGGGGVGLMGVIADIALEHGGEVIGVIPRPMLAWKVAHGSLTELNIVDTMHERKQKFFQLSDAFVALPVGFGTFEEFLEILTWAQLGFHKKPAGLLNVEGFFDKILEQFKLTVDEGFVKQIHFDMIQVASRPEGLLAKLETYIAPTFSK